MLTKRTHKLARNFMENIQMLWEEEIGFIFLLSAGLWLIQTISFEVE